MHYIHCKGYKRILQLLIDKGANVNAVDKDGRTALDAAFKANEGKLKNNCGILSIFSISESNVMFVYLAYDIKDRTEVINLLTQHGAERAGIVECITVIFFKKKH